MATTFAAPRYGSGDYLSMFFNALTLKCLLKDVLFSKPLDCLERDLFWYESDHFSGIMNFYDNFSFLIKKYYLNFFAHLIQ